VSKQAINAWTTAAGPERGKFLRPILKSGKVAGKNLSDWAIWSVVEQSVGPPAPFGEDGVLDSTHFTAKTSTSALVVPCDGTATKYSFSSGTNKPVLPSGPVGIFPMA
jgi:hypothetical protein